MYYQQIFEFKEKLHATGTTGIFMKTSDPSYVECVGYAGMDFVILDMEHGANSLQTMQNNIRAANVSGLLPIIRVPAITEYHISQALDIGALGIQVPKVQTKEDAKKAVEYAKFYPQGERGVCRFVRAAQYSATDSATYFNRANETLVIIQLEGLQAIENLDEILSVEGIDIVFIGPYDLSQSLGLIGQTTHPKVLKKMQQIIYEAKKLNIFVGTFTDSKETIKMWKQAGVQYLSYSVDVGIFYETCKEIVQTVKSF